MKRPLVGDSDGSSNDVGTHDGYGHLSAGSGSGSESAAAAAAVVSTSCSSPSSVSPSPVPTATKKNTIAWFKSRLEESKSSRRTVSTAAEIRTAGATGTGRDKSVTDALLVKGLDMISLQDVEKMTPKDGEVLMASQLNILSKEEREEVLQDIHGVSTVQDETPELLAGAIAAMAHHVNVLLDEYHNRQHKHHHHRQHQHQRHRQTQTHTQTFQRRRNEQSLEHSQLDGDHIDADDDDFLLLHPYEIAVRGSGGAGSRMRRSNITDGTAAAAAATTTSAAAADGATGTSYFASDEFWTVFLRVERYSPKEAAVRLLMYFEEKLKLFGPDMLTKKRIEVSDLDDASYRELLRGAWQLLPGRDRAGRAIIISFGDFWDRGETIEFQRAAWVFFSLVCDDEETQKRGCAFIYYAIGSVLPSLDATKKGGIFARSVPNRIASMHLCTDDDTIQAAAKVTSLLLGKNISMRFRCHKGSYMECMYALLQFGIRIDGIPIDLDGKPDTRPNQIFWQQKRQLELQAMERNRRHHESKSVNSEANDDDVDLLHIDTTESNIEGFDTVVFDQPASTTQDPQSLTASDPLHSPQGKSEPGQVDILLGRGKGVQNHPGNINYRIIIESNLERFETAKRKGEKARLVKEIVQHIHSIGGNFWKLDETSHGKTERWIPVDEKTACDKVSHSFRNAKQAQQKDDQTRRPSSSGSSNMGWADISGFSAGYSRQIENSFIHDQMKRSIMNNRNQKRPRHDDRTFLSEY